MTDFYEVPSNSPIELEQQLVLLNQQLEQSTSSSEKEHLQWEIHKLVIKLADVSMTNMEKEFRDYFVEHNVNVIENVIKPIDNFVYPSKKIDPQSSARQLVDLHSFEFETPRLREDGTLEMTCHKANYFVENLGDGIDLQMISIPPGKFLMGTPAELNDGYRSEEEPQHEVEVDGFYLGKFAVTQAQWQLIMGHDLSLEQGDNLPTVNVAWNDAQEFCKRLVLLTGRSYRLPSEAEWEYACRGGTISEYSFGDNINRHLANYWDLGCDGESIDEDSVVGSMMVSNNINTRYLSLKPVESYYPNPFGLFNMHGNVYEFCQDQWHLDYEGAPTNGKAWISKGIKGRIVIRGGSFDYYDDNCRSSYRSETLKDYRYYGTGFRVVCNS
jgi:eukaryotic-like serine/threonine-protein kinase